MDFFSDSNKYCDVANIYKLKPSIVPLYFNENMSNLRELCKNECEGARKMIEQNIDNLNSSCWRNLSLNPAGWAGELLYKNINKIDYFNICQNRSFWACKLLQICPEKLFYYSLSCNSADWAIELLSKNCDLIDMKMLHLNSSEWAHKFIKFCNFENYEYYILCENPSEWAGKIVKEHVAFMYEQFENNYIPIEIADWRNLSGNPSNWAGEIMREHFEEIVWFILSSNPSEWAREILLQYPDKIDWFWLHANKSKWAFELLEKKQNFNSSMILSNEHIFTLDYDFLRERMENTFGEELIQKQFHPKNISKFEGWGIDSGYSNDE